MHKSLDPKNFKDQKLKCDHKNPIIFALDVTGSMVIKSLKYTFI